MGSLEVMCSSSWRKELGDHLGAMTEGHALQIRVDQMFSRIPEQLSVSEL